MSVSKHYKLKSKFRTSNTLLVPVSTKFMCLSVSINCFSLSIPGEPVPDPFQKSHALTVTN